MTNRFEEHRRKVDEQKALFDAVTKAWLDEKYAALGRWSVKFVGAVILVLVLKFIWFLNAHDLRNIISIAEQAQQVSR